MEDFATKKNKGTQNWEKVSLNSKDPALGVMEDWGLRTLSMSKRKKKGKNRMAVGAEATKLN